jgi:hypothetical protein
MKNLILLAFLALTPAYGYKFLCNGITAEGYQESDNCTQSCTSAPTRWPNNMVRYNLDISVLPPGMSASSWTSLGQSCFDVWSKTPGAQLTTTYGGSGARSFGIDSNNHDVFWVTDENEWMENVGAAPDGILGVTLPPYMCPTTAVSYRRIDDADLIMNAVPSTGFNWEPGCANMSTDCQSARATLAHESGHFLGLGHPCASCQQLMSATAEYLVEYPLFDDQQGLAALYPAGSSSAGAFGTACSSSSPCQSGLVCHTQDSSQYCSSTCTTSSDCDNYMTCNSTNHLCEFPAGTQLGAVGLYGSCTANLCDTGLNCVWVSDTAAYCFSDCTNSRTCASNETCHQLSNSRGVKINSYACLQMVGQNQSCGIINSVPTVCYSGSGLTCSSDTSGLCLGSDNGKSSCSSVRTPTEIWLLLALFGLLVHRPKKKC